MKRHGSPPDEKTLLNHLGMKSRELVQKIQAYDLRHPWQEQLSHYRTFLGYLETIQREQYAGAMAAAPPPRGRSRLSSTPESGSAGTPTTALPSAALPSSRRRRKRKRRMDAEGGDDAVGTSVRPFLLSRVYPKRLPPESSDRRKIDWNQDCLSLFTHEIQESSERLSGVKPSEDAHMKEKASGADGDLDTKRKPWKRIPRGVSNCDMIVKRWKHLTRVLGGDKRGTSAASPLVPAMTPATPIGPVPEAERVMPVLRDQPDESLLKYLKPLPEGADQTVDIRDDGGSRSAAAPGAVTRPNPEESEQVNDIGRFLESTSQDVEMPLWTTGMARFQPLLQKQRSRQFGRSGKRGALSNLPQSAGRRRSPQELWNEDEELDDMLGDLPADPDAAATNHLWTRQDLALLGPAEETHLSALQEIHRRRQKAKELSMQRKRLVTGRRTGRKRRRRADKKKKASVDPDVVDPVLGVLGVAAAPTFQRFRVPSALMLAAARRGGPPSKRRKTE